MLRQVGPRSHLRSSVAALAGTCFAGAAFAAQYLVTGMGMGGYTDIAAFNGAFFSLFILALSSALMASVGWTLGLLEIPGRVVWIVIAFSLCGVVTEVSVTAVALLSGDFATGRQVASALSWLDAPGRAVAAALDLGVDRWAVGLTKPSAARTIGGLCWGLTANVVTWALLGRALAQVMRKRSSR